MISPRQIEIFEFGAVKTRYLNKALFFLSLLFLISVVVRANKKVILLKHNQDLIKRAKNTVLRLRKECFFL